MEQKQYTLNELIEKVDNLRKADDFDLSLEQDLVIAVMNLISIEEHLFFSFSKTNKPKYLNLLKEVREKRKKLLKQIIKEYEGEVRCTAKHMLATSMRLMEVATKQLWSWKNEMAETFFREAYDMYCMFWGLVLDMIWTNDISTWTSWNQANLIWNVIDCCKE